LEAILKSLHILHCLKWKTREDIVVRIEDALIKSNHEWFRCHISSVPIWH
jgi:hypothetical protein